MTALPRLSRLLLLGCVLLLLPLPSFLCAGQQQKEQQQQQRQTAAAAAAPAADAAGVKRHVGVGLYTGNKPVEEREQRYAKGEHIFQYELVYQDVKFLNFKALQNIMEAGRTPILNLGMTAKEPVPVLSYIISGTFDEFLAKFAMKAAKYGQKFWVRLLPEFNGDKYPWSVHYTWQGDRNRPQELSKALAHIVKVFTDNGAPVKFQISIDGEPGGNRAFADYFPEVAKGMAAVAITAYNRPYADAQHQSTTSFSDLFKGVYNQVAKLTTLPIWVADTGTTSKKTNKAVWLRDAFASIATDFTRVRQVTFYLSDRDEDGVNMRYDLHNDVQIKYFMIGYRKLRETAGP